MSLRNSNAVKRDRWFFRLAGGVKRIVGLPAAADLVRIEDPATGMYQSEAVRLARTVRALGEAAPEKLENWSLRLTPAERDAARLALGALAAMPLIVCGPGTKMQAKDWGQERWRELIAKLAMRYPGYGLALIGATEDAEVS